MITTLSCVIGTFQHESSWIFKRFAISKNCFFLNKEEGENSNSLKCLLEFAFMTTSLYSIHLLQDLLFAGDYFIKDNFSSHKINTPGTEEEYNWDYRFRFTIEELCEDKILSSELMSLVKKSFRI